MSPTHVVLLRGINVGRGNQLPMATLREVAEGLGWRDVATYIRSGNLVATAAGRPADLEAALHDALLGATGLDLEVFVLTAAEAVALEEACPWPQDEPRQVHAFLFREPLGPPAREAVAQAVDAAHEAGSRDEAVVDGRVLWVRTPDGFGRSALVARLDTPAHRRSAAAGEGTARNLATVRRLRAMVEQAPGG